MYLRIRVSFDKFKTVVEHENAKTNMQAYNVYNI